MRKRSRILAIAAVVTVLSAVGATFAITAKADPTSLAVDGNNGYKVQRFYHSVHDEDSASPWWVELAVDTQRGFQESTNRSFNSGVARISKGAGVVRVQVDAIRLGYGSTLVADYFPSKFTGARDNTPPGCAIPAGPGVTGLFADSSIAPGCQAVANRLNSADDYEPDASLVRGHTDWIGPIPCTNVTVASRGFFAVRWANNDYSQFSLRTGEVDANPEC